MPSLSTNAGGPNPNNFSHSKRESIKYRRELFKNGSSYDVNIGTTQYTSYVEDDLFEGRVLKKFHRRKNQGELLPYTHYTYAQRKCQVEGPVVLKAGYTYSGTVNEYNWTALSPSPSTNALPGVADYAEDWVGEMPNYIAAQGINLESYAQQAAAKLYSRGWDGLTFLAELHHIVRMFRKVGTQIFDLLTDWKNFKRDFSTIDEWLSTRYGWRILLYDIEDINKLIDDLDKKQLMRTKERTGGNESWTTYWNSTTTGEHRIRYDYEINYALDIRGSIIADFTPSRITLNPVITLWELAPFSFVIDWFFNVGRALSAIAFLHSNSQYTASYGWHVIADRTAECSITFHGKWASTGWSNWDSYKSTQVLEMKQRTPVEIPFLPTWNINLNSFKVADLLALLIQYLR